MQSSRGSMDRVSDYGSEGWGFKSLRGRVFYKDDKEKRQVYISTISYQYILK